MNKPILITSFIYQISCQVYFGWDFKITSDAEMVCAGIAFLMLSMSFFKEGTE